MTDFSHPGSSVRCRHHKPIQNRFGFAVRFLWLFAAVALSAVPASAAYYPNIAYGPKQQLVPGVTWQIATNPSPRWSIQIIEIDMTNPDIAVIPVFKSGGNAIGVANQRTSTMATRAQAIAAINAGYYNTSNNLTNSYTLIGGQFFGGAGLNMRPESNRSVLGFSAPPQAIAKRTKLNSSFVPADPVNWNKITDAIAGRGHFVTANGLLVTQDNEGTTESHHGSRHPRTAIGYSLNPYKVWFVTVDGRQTASVGMTYTELGQLMADLRIEQSISLDGGGSTTAWVKGRGVVNRTSNTNNAERAVVSAWAVVELSYSSRFSAGDWISTTATANLNLRAGPGTSFPVISSFPFGTTAVVLPDPANGIRADGHDWWRVKLYPQNLEGWWTETYLTSAEPPELPVVQISPGAAPATLSLSWPGTPGVTYRLQYSEDLANWSDIGTPTIGSGTNIARTVPISATSRAFYRLTIEY